MAKVKALHTIHRPHPTRKGEQQVIKPNAGADSEFECSGKELEGYLRRGAVKKLDTKAPAKSTKSTKAAAAKDDDKAGDDGDGLGDL